MTSTFLGKWMLSSRWGVEESYVGYLPSRRPGDFGALVIYGGALRKESNIAFILRADSQLCFLVNNGQYVVSQLDGVALMDTLALATGLTFPGHDASNLPTPFHSKIKVGENRFFTSLAGKMMAGSIEISEDFKIQQITPPLARVQAAGNGDGLDFAWVDFTGGSFNKVSLVRADFSPMT